LAIHQHRASAALSAVAPLLRSCQAEDFAQDIQQGHARLQRQIVLAAIDVQMHRSRRRKGASRGHGRWIDRRIGNRLVGHDGFVEKGSEIKHLANSIPSIYRWLNSHDAHACETFPWHFGNSYKEHGRNAYPFCKTSWQAMKKKRMQWKRVLTAKEA